MTEQEYKEICAEVQNSGIPVPSQQKIIDACWKQVAMKLVNAFAENVAGEENKKVYFGSCPNCGLEVQDSMKYCMECGQRLEGVMKNEVN